MGVRSREWESLSDDEANAYLEAWDQIQRKDDERTALLCVTIMQAMGAKKAGGGKWKLKDFLPQKKQASSEEVQRAQIRSLAK